MPFCGKCGCEVTAEEKFCGRCGNTLKEETKIEKPRNNKKIAVICAVGAIVIVLLMLVIGILIGKSLFDETEVQSEMKTEIIEETPEVTVEENSDFDAALTDATAVKLLEDIKTDWQTLYDCEPLVMYGDWNFDSINELVVLVQTDQPDGVPEADYKYWTVFNDKAELITEGCLYREVGGNCGFLTFLTDVDTGDLYWCQFRHYADGDGYTDEYTIIPVVNGDSTLEMDAATIVVVEVEVDGPQYYEVNGTCVDEASAMEVFNSFYWGEQMDLWEGHGNGLVWGLDDAINMLK